MMLNPSFKVCKAEAELIGHMLTAYGELELLVGICLGTALRDEAAAMRMMFRILGESTRISAADAIMRGWYRHYGLDGEYGCAIGAMRKCIHLRNQYAHCHWADSDDGQLFFTNLQDSAKAFETFEYWWRHVDVPLLTQQSDYFEYAAQWLQYVHFEGELRSKLRSDHEFPKPKARKPPPPYNPPEQHIPPWLDPDAQQRHIERAREQGARAHSPQDGQPQGWAEAKCHEERLFHGQPNLEHPGQNPGNFYTLSSA